ncbi:MAG: hypothetical protein Q7S37_00590 [bacterium]|nr:hypothetical protein [bacterium]
MTKLRRVFIRFSILAIVVQSVMVGILLRPNAVHAAESLITSYTMTNTYISPNSDGIQDSTEIDLLFSRSVKVTMDILDSTDLVTAHIYDSNGVKDPQPKNWYGRYSKEATGPIVPDEQYTVRIVLKDIVTDEILETDTSKKVIVDTVAPTAVVDYSVTDPTNDPVAATITPSEALQTPVELSYIFTENGAYTFLFSDLAGNPGSVIANVANIRMTAILALISTPTAPVMEFTETLYSEDTHQPLSDQFNSSNLSAEDYFEANGVMINAFSYDPIAKTLLFSLTQPAVGATISFKDAPGKGVTDHVGNRYEPQIGRFNGTMWVLSDGSDNTAPTAFIQYSTTEPTNQDVVATLVASEPLIPNTELTHIFSSNGSFTFIISDLSGNVSLIEAVVNNIDKTPPALPVISSLKLVEGSVGLKFTYSLDTVKVLIEVSKTPLFSEIERSVIQQPPTGDYSLNDLTSGVNYYFRITAYDTAGNISSSLNGQLAIPAELLNVVEDTTAQATVTQTNEASYRFIPLAEAAEPEPEVKPSTKTEGKKGEIKSVEDKKEPKGRKGRDILFIVALLAIAGVAYYGYKKLPESDEVVESSKGPLDKKTGRKVKSSKKKG